MWIFAWEKTASAKAARPSIAKYDFFERKYPVRLHAGDFLVTAVPGADRIMPTAIPRRQRFDSAPAPQEQYCRKIKFLTSQIDCSLLVHSLLLNINQRYTEASLSKASVVYVQTRNGSTLGNCIIHRE